MLKEKTVPFRRLLLVFDGLTIIVSYIVSLYLRMNLRFISRAEPFYGNPFLKDTSAAISGEYIAILALAVPAWCLILYLNGIYRPWRTRGIFEIIGIIFKSMFFVLIGFGVFIFLLKLNFISRLFVLIFLLSSFLFLTVEKTILFLAMRYIRRRGHNIVRLLVVGTGRRASIFIRKIKSHPEWGLSVIGALDDEPGRGFRNVDWVPIIGSVNEIVKKIKDEAIDQVYFIVPRSRLNYIENAVRECEVLGIKALVAVDLFELKMAKSRHQELDDMPFVSFETTVVSETQWFIKRIIDMSLSGVGLILLLPLFILIGALIKISSRGPMIFQQVRSGLNGREFTLYKFRTMRVGAEKERQQLELFNELSGPIFKIKNDPRVTPIGRILRKLSLDELPQLLNIFVGHMSLIGPRALATYEVEKFEPWQRRRMSMRPGLTGLWQVSGRNRAGFDRMMKLDLQYLDHWSLLADFKILLKTIPNVLFGRGAY